MRHLTSFSQSSSIWRWLVVLQLEDRSATFLSSSPTVMSPLNYPVMDLDLSDDELSLPQPWAVCEHDTFYVFYFCPCEDHICWVKGLENCVEFFELFAISPLPNYTFLNLLARKVRLTGFVCNSSFASKTIHYVHYCVMYQKRTNTKHN